jgi:hypothetical protein
VPLVPSGGIEADLRDCDGSLPGIYDLESEMPLWEVIGRINAYARGHGYTPLPPGTISVGGVIEGPHGHDPQTHSVAVHRPCGVHQAKDQACTCDTQRNGFKVVDSGILAYSGWSR